MHSVLQDEWEEADPGRGERVGVQYLGQRSGENFDYHVWTVKVDRPEAAAGEEGGTEEARVVRGRRAKMPAGNQPWTIRTEVSRSSGN